MQKFSPIKTYIFFILSYNTYNIFQKYSGRPEYLILPHPNTLHKICLSSDIGPQSEQFEEKFLHYIKQKVSNLKENDKIVALMLDEIHIKPFFDFKGGNIIGQAFNGSEAATSAHVFMISSLKSTYKDVVHVLPVKKLTAEVLFTYIKKIIIGLENLGLKVIAIVTDNNAINKKSLSLFTSPPSNQIVYPHPVDITRPLFFIIDFVHLLKCIRNNWLAQKNAGRCFYFPAFDLILNAVFNNIDHSLKSGDLQACANVCIASFCTLINLHKHEVSNLLKYSYNLSFKALTPNTFEKQNVKLVLQIFNEHVSNGLHEFASKQTDLQHCEGTAQFIDIINRWWAIVNVKTPFVGIRENNEYRMPLKNDPSGNQLIFLNAFIDWLDAWKEMKCTTGMLSKETHWALKHSSYALLEILKYCTTELDFDYILPGKLQTDCLESRFGCYRQFAGAQYNISLRQVFEIEKKIRTQSMLSIALKDDRGHIRLPNCGVDFDPALGLPKNVLDISKVEITEDDILSLKDTLAIIHYIAGYCLRAVLKKLKCSSCKDILTVDDAIRMSYSYIEQMDRGGLLYPHESVVNAVLYTFIVVEKMCKNDDFLKCPNHRELVFSATYELITSNELIDEVDECTEHHCIGHVFQIIVWAATNTLLNNFCKRKNDLLCSKDVSKRRKLNTLAK